MLNNNIKYDKLKLNKKNYNYKIGSCLISNKLYNTI